MKVKLRLSRTGLHPQTSQRSEVFCGPWDATADSSLSSQVACPLHELTSGENAGKKKAPIKWDSRCQQAFDDLKKLCTTAPILTYANFTKPFKLHTDAYGFGLGVVLYQTREDGTETVIAYASRSLSKAESTTQHTSWSFSPSSGQWLRNSMSTYMGQPSMYTLTTIHSHTY